MAAPPSIRIPAIEHSRLRAGVPTGEPAGHDEGLGLIRRSERLRVVLPFRCVPDRVRRLAAAPLWMTLGLSLGSRRVRSSIGIVTTFRRVTGVTPVTLCASATHDSSRSGPGVDEDDGLRARDLHLVGAVVVVGVQHFGGGAPRATRSVAANPAEATNTPKAGHTSSARAYLSTNVLPVHASWGWPGRVELKHPRRKHT